MKARLVEHVAWREVEGETLVVDLTHNVMYGLNRPGGLVWKAIEGGDDLDALPHRLAPQTPEHARRAVQDFVAQLLGHGLVTGETDVAAVLSTSDLAHPPGSFLPPQVVWQEPLHGVGQAVCGLAPGQGGPCDVAPRS